MKVIRDIASHHIGPCVATIGNFDGVHQGHQAILAQLRKAAKQAGLPSVVVSFDPSPAEFFQPASAPARLMRLREKVTLLKQFGVDELIVLRFDASLAQLSAHDFVQTVLVQGLQAKCLIVGDDFRFGYQRQGDYELLCALSSVFEYDVIESVSTHYQDERVSSTRVRAALQQGQFDQVTALLGRPYSNAGHIVHGAALGRKLGYPTANIPMRRITSPLHGIYVVTMTGIADHPLPGVASVGTRPVVSGQSFLLEVHLFDFDADIYGRLVEVQYYHKLRDELPFDSLDDLIEQMHIDAAQAKQFFETQSPL